MEHRSSKAAEASSERSTAPILAPPPLVFLIALVVGLALDWLLPLDLLSTVPTALRYAVGGTLLLLALALAQPGKRAFRRAGTPVLPWQPTKALVTDGVYGRARNPMYVALVLVLVGGGIAFAGDWTVAMAVPLGLALHYGVVLREERYLETLFGDDYRQYCERVPRYGWRW